MTWQERWRSENRPNADEIPSRFAIWPDTKGWAIFGYFSGVIALFLGSLYTFGTDPTLLLGLPYLTWISAFVVVAFFVGMLGVMYLEGGEGA